MGPLQQNQTPTPPLPIEEIKPPHNHKILWILLSVFILLSVAGLFVFKNQIKEKSEVSLVQNIATTTDEFAGWKTYRNEEYGFEFKYPADWGMDDSMKNKDFYVLNSNETQKYHEESKCIECPSDLLISIEHNPKLLSAKDFFNGIDASVYFDNPKEDKVIKVDNVTSYKVYPATGLAPSVSIIIPYKDVFIEFNTMKDEKLMDKILSTFKFIDSTSTDTSTWKTYKNEEYGFEFKYPVNLSYKFEIVDSYNNQEQITGAFYNGDAYLFSFRMNGDFGYSEGCNEYGTKEDKIINGIKMVKENNCGEIVYYFQPSNQHFFFGTAYENDIKILDQIISTFKFTK